MAQGANNQAEAKEQGKAEAARLNRGLGACHFTQYGRLDASAEADIIASGFGQIESGTWMCNAVENTFDDGGFTTAMEVEAPETTKNLAQMGKQPLAAVCLNGQSCVVSCSGN